MYYAIIGDIKNSKEIDNRYEVQNKLKKILDDINLKYKADIKANFLITLGDEFQGLLNSPAFALEIVKYIQRELYPVKLRFGIGKTDGREKTQKEVADLLGISQSYISRLEKRIMKRLRKEIVKYE